MSDTSLRGWLSSGAVGVGQLFPALGDGPEIEVLQLLGGFNQHGSGFGELPAAARVGTQACQFVDLGDTDLCVAELLVTAIVHALTLR